MNKFYITPDLSYYDASDNVSVGSVECAERPTEQHILTDNWVDDPLDPAVCWRAKTAAEIDAEKVAEGTREIDKDKLIKLIALVFFDHENRIRILEGKAEIDMPTFKQALIDRYKKL